LAKIRLFLASGAEIVEHDDNIEEADELYDRVMSRDGKPFWMVVGDSLVFTQALSGAQIA